MKKDIKKIRMKRLVAGILVGVLLLAGIYFLPKNLGNVKATVDITKIHTEIMDVSTYVKDGTRLAPKPVESGYEEWIFAGWYEDSACGTPFKGDTGKKYAKFVPAEVLSVKCQVLSGTTASTPKSSMRIVSTVDSLNYREVGFDIALGGVLKSFPYHSVCESVAEVDGGVSFDYDPVDFHPLAQYFTTVTLTNIGQNRFDDGFYIRPYWKTLDGTTVYGVDRYARVEDSYLKIVNVPIRLHSDKEVIAGYLEVEYDKELFTYYPNQDGTIDTGLVFTEADAAADETDGLVRCVGDVSGTENVKAEGLFQNLRFQVNGDFLPEVADFYVRSEMFNDNTEADVSLNVSDVEYKQITKTTKQVDVWTTNGSEKICRNIDYTSMYESTEEPALTINMVKNEKEGAQVILTAAEDVDKYIVSVSDLKSENGVIKADSISIFHEKYMELQEQKNGYTAIKAEDWVPDALLPYQTALDYRENKVAKGENQGIYIEVETTEDTLPGTYNGTIMVKADGQLEQLPMTVTVSDITLPSISKAQNYWGNAQRSHWANAEEDWSDAMARQYLDTMLEYNMCGELPFDESTGTADAYAQLVREYYFKDGFSTYVFYHKAKTGTYNGETCYFDVAIFKDYLKAVATLSVEDNVNYLDKAVFYFHTIIDEPSDEEAYKKVQSVYACYQTALAEIDTELKETLAGHTNASFYTNTVSETLLNIPNVLPEKFDDTESILEDDYGIKNITHCLQTSFVNKTLGIFRTGVKYGDGDWFYTCSVPVYPEVTNHLENDLLGMKIVSWMQYYYDVDGYLNWAVANHDRGDVDDSYNLGKAEGNFIAGDGYMFYPGREYGIYGPVPSLRAVQYRDGVEDYDLWDILCNKMQDDTTSFESFSKSLFDSVVSNYTQPTTSTTDYYSARSELINKILTELQ